MTPVKPERKFGKAGVLPPSAFRDARQRRP